MLEVEREVREPQGQTGEEIRNLGFQSNVWEMRKEMPEGLTNWLTKIAIALLKAQTSLPNFVKAPKHKKVKVDPSGQLEPDLHEPEFFQVRIILGFGQSYKSRTSYCTVFSLQRDVLNLRIGIPGSYRFEFQKIKKY